MPKAKLAVVTMAALPTYEDAKAALLAADALAYACERVRMVRDEKITFFGLELSWFEKTDCRALVREMMKRGAQQPLAMMDLANMARAGWDLADEAMRELIIEYQHNKLDMPPTLEAYNMEITDPRRRVRHDGVKGRKTADNVLRDITTTALIGDVCRTFSLTPTRSRLSKRKRPSGCGIVAQALREEHVTSIEDEAVIRIWARYGAIAFPGAAWSR
jgi:hypothetical protein